MSIKIYLIESFVGKDNAGTVISPTIHAIRVRRTSAVKIYDKVVADVHRRKTGRKVEIREITFGW